MAAFSTVDVLSTTTGRLLGDIGGVYKVVSYLVGRDVFTHELVTYGERAAAAIKAALPDIPVEADATHVNGKNFTLFRDEWVLRLGANIELPDSLRECLADDRSAISTLTDLVGRDRVVVVKSGKRT